MTLGNEEGYTLEQAGVNTLRALSCEAISNANSGHSGIALGAAPIMYSIYNAMKFDPSNGSWFNRDRFVMSAGHGSALLYTTLKCFGFGVDYYPKKKRNKPPFVSIDLKTFRSLGSHLHGHPEYNEAMGVDCSTGPLGQGLAMAVGIALGEKKLAAEFNMPDNEIIDHYTFCLAGDGCLMEGASYEACSLAGLWHLNKLIVLYDANNVTLDGFRGISDNENVKMRFKAMNWNVLEVPDGDDEYAITAKIKRAKASKDKPTIIIINTTIGFGAKNQGTSKAHGQVLTMEECKQFRQDWELLSDVFEVDPDVAEHFEKLIYKKRKNYRKWAKQLKDYSFDYPEYFCELEDFILKTKSKYQCFPTGETKSGRDIGHDMLNQIACQNARLFGGGADVASTTKTFVSRNDGSLHYFSHDDQTGENIAFGVREFAMACISNGLALHNFTPYCSTFLSFSDYCKPAMRLTAMMNLPVTYIFTHDGLGNPPDGPTHQANEHIASLRLIPNFSVFRPCDDLEVASVYEYVFEAGIPNAIILSRGDLVTACGVDKGCVEYPRAVLLASGTEVSLCHRAQKILGACGVFVNVESVPCLEHYNFGKLNKSLPVLAVEMGSAMPWWAMFGRHEIRGDVVGFDRFGASGAGGDVTKELGFTPEQIADKVLNLLGIVLG